MPLTPAEKAELKAATNTLEHAIQCRDALEDRPSQVVDHQPLEQGLGSMFDNPRYSDLVVTCSGRAFKVHKTVVCSQSKWFAKKLLGPWASAPCKPDINTPAKEAESGVIDLDADDPNAVEAMLRFYYTSSYNEDDKIDAESGAVVPPALLNAQVYTIADKYNILELKNLSKTKFKLAVVTSLTNDGLQDALAKLYILANRYNIVELRTLMETEYAFGTATPQAPCTFHDVVAEVYSSTPTADRGLRDIVLTATMDNIEVVSRDRGGFRKTLENNPDFAADVTEAVLTRGLI
ncbi:hypothetical protein B0A49_12321 [Cryomyces minteri]|uniref:BTB domain-containing protein n=1 Tax=Cryomyces minteri TaxID=331657 RepID=A0A4U0VLZ7_9PEZI|nr:hypothetical protein B0A49_12321 [Cryomyces minteri]